MSEYNATVNGGDTGGFDGGSDKERLHEWEMGLPSGIDLAPLSQLLIPPDLASAFRISPQQSRTAHDVNRASQSTVSSLRNSGGDPEEEAAEEEEEEEEGDRVGSELKKQRKNTAEDTSSGEVDSDATAERTALKRQRMVWTPQLHKRFLDVMSHLGVDNAVPKTIMQMMNVEGLTRENVASHLQKYRIYLKQKQVISDDTSSSSNGVAYPNVGGASRPGGQVGSPFPAPYVGVEPMMTAPDFRHLGLQGFQGPYNHGHDPYNHNHNHRPHHGGGGFGTNPYMSQQHGTGDAEGRTQRL